MVINPRHSPIIIEEDYEPSRGDARGFDAAIAPTIADIEEAVTSVTIDSQRTITSVTTNSGKADTPVTTNLTIVTKDPPYPQRLVEPRMTSQPETDFLKELQNLCVRIPLLQALKEVPIYAKIVTDLCIKKPRRNRKDPATTRDGKVIRINDCSASPY